MQFTDSHCHLDGKAFNETLPELLAQCQQLNINRIIVPSIAPSNFENVLHLSKTYHNNPIQIYPCLGIHPWFLQSLDESHLAQLSEVVSQVRSQSTADIVAIGEIGLDGAIAKKAEEYGQTVEENWRQQQHFFDYQLNLAKQENLPVIVHHRQSHDKIVPLLKRYQLARSGIIHGFSGSYQQATQYIDLGFKLGVGSTITYSRAKKTINTIKRLPLTSLVLETDAPSMPLSPEVLGNELVGSDSEVFFPKLFNDNDEKQVTAGNEALTNSPINIIKIFSILTSIRSESPEEIAKQLELNIEDVFFNQY